MSCIVCGQEAIEPFLDLGCTALANRFVSRTNLRCPEPTYPLRVGFCHSCHHVQLLERVPPASLFQDYLYVSSASETLRHHFEDLSATLVRRCNLSAEDPVLDVGCNDGTLLKAFHQHRLRTLGVDPAENLTGFTNGTGIERFVGFFNSDNAKCIANTWGQATLITATNTFSHIPDLRDFVQAVNTLLKPGGSLVIEAHYLLDMIEQRAFDTIYHEHCSYWALGPMQYLFATLGFEIVDVERLPFHHGQIRVFVQRKGEGKVKSSVRRLLSFERCAELHCLKTYQKFARRTYETKRSLYALLTGLRSQGRHLAGYGAPAKGNTLLAFVGIGPEILDFIVDRSPLKQGLYTPGTHIPVVAPEFLLQQQPAYSLLLAWNFVDEIMNQQAEYRKKGKFIVPVPEPHVV